MNVLPYKLITDSDCTRLGLVVLQSDVTIEDEFRYYFDNTEVSILVSRIAFENEVTADTLKAMQHYLQQTMHLFPVDVRFDAVGYGCTSGALHIGHDTINSIINAERPSANVTNPMLAAVTAMQTIGARNIGYLSPYAVNISQGMIDEFNQNSINVRCAATFDEPQDRLVGRISPESIYQGAIALAEQGDVDAIFISCTNMKAAHIIADIERETGLYVISSNQALAWHLARLTGVDVDNTKGRLFGAGLNIRN